MTNAQPRYMIVMYQLAVRLGNWAMSVAALGVFSLVGAFLLREETLLLGAIISAGVAVGLALGSLVAWHLVGNLEEE